PQPAGQARAGGARGLQAAHRPECRALHDRRHLGRALHYRDLARGDRARPGQREHPQAERAHRGRRARAAVPDLPRLPARAASLTRREIERRLREARLCYGHGTHDPREEAAWLRSRITNREKQEQILERRIQKRIPLAYLLNEAWLGKLRFYVDVRAIVPRSFIAELLRERLRPWLHREPRS